MALEKILAAVLGVGGTVRAERDTADQSIALHHVDEVNGLPVSASNPKPIADGTDATGVTPPAGASGARGWLSALFTATGVTTDTAWTSGAGSVIALLKAAATSLTSIATQTSGSATAANQGTGNTSLAAISASLSGTLTTKPIGSNGTDSGGSAPAVGNVLGTFTVTNPGQYRVQNQSAATLQVVFDDGAGGNLSVLLLAPGAGANMQGADTSPEMAWFTGRIRVAGPATSQYFARHN